MYYIKFMPELPEVEITKEKLKKLINKKIIGFWTDLPKAILNLKKNSISKDILNQKIKDIKRKGKAVLIYLEKNKNETLLAIHQRMSGRFIIKNKNEKTKYVHLKILFNDKSELWFEDQRKFGTIWYGSEKDVLNQKYFKNLGKDAHNINFNDFYKIISEKNASIKSVLLNQKNLSGLGNAYSDEALWLSKIHPKQIAKNLNKNEIKKLWKAIKMVLNKGIKLQGISMRNWLHPDGEKGKMQENFNVYQQKNCKRCGSKIQKIKIASRNSNFCPNCQKINKFKFKI